MSKQKSAVDGRARRVGGSRVAPFGLDALMGAGWMVSVRPSRLKTENQPAPTLEKVVVSATATAPELFCLRPREHSEKASA